MALQWSAIDAAIRTWLGATASELTWYRASQRVPMPAKPCGRWRWARTHDTPTAQGAMPDARTADGSGMHTGHHRRHLLEVQAFADSVVGDTTAAVYMQQAYDGLELESVQEALRGAGLRIIKRGGVQDLTALLPDRAESRALAEFVVYTADETVQQLGSIETVTPLTGTVTSGGDAIVNGGSGFDSGFDDGFGA